MTPMPKFDLLSVAGLRPKKKNRIPAKYASFNHRMMAATIDSFLIMIIFAPLLDAIFNQYWGVVVIDQGALQEKMAGKPEGLPQISIVWHELVASGALARWFANMGVQCGVLAVLTGICWHYWSATPGKMLLRLRVVDADTEQKLTVPQILVRLLGYFVSSFCFLLGYIWIGFDSRRQGWHDKMANSVVLFEPLAINWPWKKHTQSAAEPEVIIEPIPAFPTDNPSGSPAPSAAV